MACSRLQPPPPSPFGVQFMCVKNALEPSRKEKRADGNDSGNFAFETYDATIRAIEDPGIRVGGFSLVSC